MMNTAIQNANAAQQQGEAMGDAMDNQAKVLEIARRIAKGGKVPPKDEQALMEYSVELYQMAKQAAMMAKERKEYDALIEEESKKAEQNDSDEGMVDTRYQVQVDISLGESPVVESVSEVAISTGN